MEHQAKTLTLAKVNNQEIVVVENGEKRVAIKPICEALGIDVESQRKKIKEHPIYSSVAVLSTATGADGKSYEMYTLPLEYIFGWLFSVDSRNVKPEAQASVLKYQKECHVVLNYHFYIKPLEDAQFDKVKLQRMNDAYEKLELLRTSKNKLNSDLKEAQKNLDAARFLTKDQYKAEKAQTVIAFEEFTQDVEHNNMEE